MPRTCLRPVSADGGDDLCSESSPENAFAEISVQRVAGGTSYRVEIGLRTVNYPGRESM